MTDLIDTAGWERLAQDLAAGRKSLIDLWGDPGVVRIALLPFPTDSVRGSRRPSR